LADIRWFSSMFDFNTFICMLGFVHWSGQDEAQDPESCLLCLRLHGVLCYSWLYTCFYYTYGCDHTMRLYIHDDPCYLDGCAHTMDLLSSLHHSDGCVHVIDSCLDLKYVHVYASFICSSPNSACPHPCQKLVRHLNHHYSFYLHALGGICYAIFAHASCTSLWHTLNFMKHDHYIVYSSMYTAQIPPLTLLGKSL